jgi:hypothetical protein
MPLRAGYAAPREAPLPSEMCGSGRAFCARRSQIATRGIVLWSLASLLVVPLMMVIVVMVVVTVLPGRVVDVSVVMPEAAGSERRDRCGQNEGWREACRDHASALSIGRARAERPGST